MKVGRYYLGSLCDRSRFTDTTCTITAIPFTQNKIPQNQETMIQSVTCLCAEAKIPSFSSQDLSPSSCMSNRRTKEKPRGQKDEMREEE
jgi:hypothetical protein